MRIPSLPDAHLSYCLNVHPGDTLEKARQALFGDAVSVYGKVAVEKNISVPFGVGGWFASDVLADMDSEVLEKFKSEVAEHNLYYFTLNGFPYGVFHGTEIKTKVYQPDWSTPQRLLYTCALVDVLAGLLPEDTEGTISTLPVAYRELADAGVLAAAARNFAQAAIYCKEKFDRTGRKVRIAIEPEPDCQLDDIASTISYYNDHLLKCGAQYLQGEKAMSPDEAERCIREYVGICLDTVHAAVLFEDPSEILSALSAQGIGVYKIQLGAAIGGMANDGFRDEVVAFADPVYLHQTCVRGTDGVKRFADLDKALDVYNADASEWRVHYHVPLHWEGAGSLSPASGVDAGFLKKAYACGVRHFEVEIYTLGVMPGSAGREHDILKNDLCHVLDMFAGCD